jgi:hypothetical protein
MLQNVSNDIIIVVTFPFFLGIIYFFSADSIQIEFVGYVVTTSSQMSEIFCLQTVVYT